MTYLFQLTQFIHGSDTSEAFKKQFHHRIIADEGIKCIFIGKRQVEWAGILQRNPDVGCIVKIDAVR